MSAARDRLKTGYYNNRELAAGSNPGGMARNGHRVNFTLALKDVGDVAQEIVDDNDALLAAVVADNDATQAAIASDNAAAVAAVDADATAANASKVAAAASEGAASGSATTATNAATDARRTVANNFPDRLDATGSWFTEASVGDPGTVASPASGISNVAGYGFEYTKANSQGQLFTKGALAAANGKVYEVEAEVEWTVKGGAETPSLTVGVQGLDAAFANAGGQVQAPLQAVGAVGVVTMKYRFGYTAPAGGAAWPTPGASIWLRPYVLFNRKSDNSGPVTASTARVRRLTVRDVTAVVAAEISAAAAAASAASVTVASQAEAEQGTGTGLMSSPLVAQAIAAQATPIGSVVRSVASPGAKFLLCDGASYLKATYPTLSALLGDRFATYSITIPTVKAGFSFRALYTEPGLVIAAGTNGNIQTSADAATWTERALSTTNFNE